MAQVAAEAGVSTATVSRALTGSKSVTEATTRRVRAAAEKLGYTGNSIARALRRRTTGNIGMLVPSIANPFFTSLVESVEHHLVSLGLNLFLCDSRNDPAVESSRLASLTEGNVDGVLMSPCHANQSRPALERAARLLPLVQIDRRVEDAGTDWVGLDDAHAMGLIADHLHTRGARSVVFVSSTTGSSSAELRLRSIRAALARHGLSLREHDILDGDFSLAWGAQAADRLLDRANLPDAVICSDDVIALGLLGRFHHRGVRVPHEVMVTGFDDIDFASIGSVTLTTVRQPLSQMTAEAVRLLQETIRTANRATQTVSLRGELMARASTEVRR